MGTEVPSFVAKSVIRHVLYKGMIKNFIYKILPQFITSYSFLHRRPA